MQNTSKMVKLVEVWKRKNLRQQICDFIGYSNGDAELKKEESTGSQSEKVSTCFDWSIS